MTKNNDTSRHINAVVFCGGRGSMSIIQELLRRSHVQLTLIVNAYDDGLSTGALRDFISEMLGPSDFRKNLSYLLDPYSEGQYALKNLLEFRLPKSVEKFELTHLVDFFKLKKFSPVFEPIQQLFSQLTPPLIEQIHQYLRVFFDYAVSTAKPFDFRDCSLGNLIFAGVYLAHDQDFNTAAKHMSELVSSRATLVNVSKSENRILVGLKEDGELLKNEASIVGSQSNVAIKNIYLIKQSILSEDWDKIKDASLSEKEAWLQAQESLPMLSVEAAHALSEADIIIYGPGTQHSSLFPSYKIAHAAIQKSNAIIKAFVMNLSPDHDIQSLSASDILDHALFYLQDVDNQQPSITHVLLDKMISSRNLNCGFLTEYSYKNITILSENYSTLPHTAIHNGRVVIDTLFSLYEKFIITKQNYSGIDIFIDLHKRSCASTSLSQEFLEMDWSNKFSNTTLTLNHELIDQYASLEDVTITQSRYEGIFPEINCFENWLHQGKSEYLVLLTGDGEYCLRDVMLGIHLLEQTQFGAAFGSRNQNRFQFKVSLHAAYHDNKFLRLLSLCGAFLVSAILSLRFGIIYSDPLTGFRIFKHSRLVHLKNKSLKKVKTPISIVKYLLNHKIEIAEYPVNYRIYSGFSDPHWRFKRGLKNLLSTFKWGES